MDDRQITDLARQYAEEKASMMKGSMATQGEAENVIRFLLRRYALVEKESVLKLMDEHRKENRKADKGSREWFYYNGRLDLLKSLFPDMAKEGRNEAEI